MRKTAIFVFALIALGVFIMQRLFSDPVRKLADGIAAAEGFGANPGNLPTRTHNPGDLKVGDKGLGFQEGKTVFASDLDGWNALYHQIYIMLAGLSRYYSRSMSITELSQVWINGARGNDSGNAQQWAQTVADYCGVTVDTQLKDIV